MKVKLDTAADGVRIEILPLIDVVFCILIFFMLAALQLTRQEAINVDLPNAGTATLQNEQTLMVSIDAVGRIYVDRSTVSQDQLYLILEGYRRTNPLGLMVLYADRNAIYDDVVSVLDLMRSVGGDRVALATIADDVTRDRSGSEALFLDGFESEFEGLGNDNFGDGNLGNDNLNLEPLFPSSESNEIQPDPLPFLGSDGDTNSAE
jgi:biopolymer transport protein ExbD